MRAVILRVGWLHVADFGIAADWLGQLFTVLLSKWSGHNVRERCDALWTRIHDLYTVFPAAARLDAFNLNMLSSNKASPKHRAYGAETRGLVPFARPLAMEMLNDSDAIEQAMKQTTLELSACYDCLSQDAPFAADKLADHCRRFCALWVSLESQPKTFRVKPKLHLFQELCEMHAAGRPTAHWTYRDEYFGGSMASLGRRLVNG